MSMTTVTTKTASDVSEDQVSFTTEIKHVRAEPAARHKFNFDALKATMPASHADSSILLENPKSEAMISKALEEQVLTVDNDTCEAGAENSFFVCDLGKVERLLQIWRQNLPRVQPFYAVKCNPDVEVLKLLASQGVNFDCASKGEIETVLSLGIDPSRIIYANPCKVGSFLRYANKNDINMTTFDNADELYKIKKFHPGCKLLLRIITDDESAQCRLSTKFGAPLSNVSNLLNLAKELGLQVVGVAFHVGSGANDNDSLIKAVKDARDVFDEGNGLNFDMNILDVGGGFSYESFEASSEALSYSLDKYFPIESNVQVIAEPGRYFVANAFTLATHIIAKRGSVFDSSSSEQQTPTMIYINDGVYGNMNCILFDHQVPEAHVLAHRGQFQYGEHNQQTQKTYNVSIWGPTCDGLDCIASNTYLSRNVTVGDWLYFPHLGAYTSAAASPFNGFEAQAKTIYVNSNK